MAVSPDTWSPFQSSQVRDVCAHLTPAERSRLSRRSLAYGGWVFLTVSGPLAFGWWWSGSRLLQAISVLFLGVHVCGIPFWQGRVRRFLCNTEWARAQNMRPEEFRLFAAPAPKK